MTDKEMNSYRLTGLEEPTDEMLAQIMREAAEAACARATVAHERLFAQIRADINRRHSRTICK